MTTEAMHLSTEIELDLPAEAAWRIVADYGLDPHWRKGVTTMDPSTPGTAQVGTTTREVLRFAGRTWHNDGEVVAVDEGRCFDWRTTKGAEAWGRRSVTPLGPDRSLVRLELHVRPGRSERPMAPILRRLLARNLRGDAQRLAAYVPQATAAAR